MIIQIRNAAGRRQEFREEEQMPKRELISKRAMRKIINIKDDQYTEMRRTYESRLSTQVSLTSQAKYELKLRTRLTYYVGAATFLIGGGLGWLMS